MNREKTLTASLDYLLGKSAGTTPDHLVYFDHLGNRYESPVSPQLVAAAVKVFDGKPRSLRRSSGGVSLVHPVQLLVYPDGKGSVELRVRLQFQDYKLLPTGLQVVKHTKIAELAEIGPAFDYLLHLPQRFVADFGKGLVPVYLFHTEGSEVCFVDPKDWERATLSLRGESVLLQPYSMPKDLVRLGTGSDFQKGKSVFDLAHSRLKQIKEQAGTAFPAALKLGGQLEVPTGERPEDLRHYLRVSVSEQSKLKALGEKPLLGKEIGEVSESGLIPFGLLE